MAGMRLAELLNRSLPGCTIHLFDKRARLPHPERTFCFFSDQIASSFNLPVTQTWHQVNFSHTAFNRSCNCKDTPYQLVRGDDFFSQTLLYLESHGVRFSWEEQIVEIAPGVIRTGSKSYTFDLVIDTAYSVSNISPLLWQSFGGYWVTTRSDSFNPHQATLMEINPAPSPHPLNFIYILPLSTRSALVEHTSFCAAPIPLSKHLEQCTNWLNNRCGAEWKIDQTEEGLIPMGNPPVKATPGILRFGSSSGSIRASTGYAFINILKQAEQIVKHIKNNQHSSIEDLSTFIPKSYPGWINYADKIFLKILRNNPQYGPNILSKLLEKAPEKPLLQFLAGDVNPLAALRVMLSTPKWIMLRASVNA